VCSLLLPQRSRRLTELCVWGALLEACARSSPAKRREERRTGRDQLVYGALELRSVVTG
jgi:hypothetical protein